MKVLNVDDNLNNRLIIQLLLEDFDEITLIDEAEDGAEAVAKCQEQTYDLIFMDIMMPGINGIEATKQIASKSKTTMIIAVSALDDEESKYQMLKNGAEDYIVKPIHDELFKQRVKQYFSIISMRKTPIYNSLKYSLYEGSVYPLAKTFNIDSEEAMAYFWDYWLNNDNKKPKFLSDAIRIVYGIGLWILKTKKPCIIYSEENEDAQFITIKLSSGINETITRNILQKHYVGPDYLISGGILSLKLLKNTTLAAVAANNIKLKEEDSTILNKTYVHGTISAEEFFQSVAIEYMDKIEALEDIELHIEQALISIETGQRNFLLKELSDYYMDYVDTLTRLMKFNDLAHAVKSISSFLYELKIEQIDEKNLHKLVSLNLLLLDDLREWRENIFVLKTAKNINYLDASLLSSCLQIESIFHEKEIGDDIEFF